MQPQINVLVDTSSGRQCTVNVYDYIGESCVCFRNGTCDSDRRSQRVFIAGCRENSPSARASILTPLLNAAATKGIGCKLTTPHGFRSERNSLTYCCSQRRSGCSFNFTVYWDVDIQRWYLWPSGAGNPLHNHAVFFQANNAGSLIPRTTGRRPPIIFQPQTQYVFPQQPVFLWLLPRPTPHALPSSVYSSILPLCASHTPKEVTNSSQRRIKSVGAKHKYRQAEDKILNCAMFQTDNRLNAKGEVSKTPKENDMATSNDLSHPVSSDACNQHNDVTVPQQHEISGLSNKPSRKRIEENTDLFIPADPLIAATTKEVNCEPQIAAITREVHCHDLSRPVSDVCKQNIAVTVSQEDEISGLSVKPSQKHKAENTDMCIPADPQIAATAKEVHCEPKIAATTKELHCHDLWHPVSDVCQQNNAVTVSQQHEISGLSVKSSQSEENTDFCITANAQIAATTKEVYCEPQKAAITKEVHCEQSDDYACGNVSFFQHAVNSVKDNPWPMVDDGFVDSDEEIYC